MNRLVPDQQMLLAVARDAMVHAYAPYSRFKVGAAILLQNGRVFAGCNVENASYGLTNCAERTAVFAAVAQLGGEHVKIQAVAVVNSADSACAPCGACRQVLAEFGSDAIVFYQSKGGIKSARLKELLPDCFEL